MIISFDMDETLVSVEPNFAEEKYTAICRLLGAERLRRGTRRLFPALAARGHNIYIYTTSHRSKFSLRKTFLAYGLWPDRIINGEENRKRLALHNCGASKNPGLFAIDLHVDDLAGVQMEAVKFGFTTLVVDVHDTAWVEKVLTSVDAYTEQE